MNHLTDEQIAVIALVKEAGYECAIAPVKLCDASNKTKSDIFSVVAILGDERYNVRVSLKKNKVLSVDLLVVLWKPSQATGELMPFVKRFSRNLNLRKAS